MRTFGRWLGIVSGAVLAVLFGGAVLLGLGFVVWKVWDEAPIAGALLALMLLAVAGFIASVIIEER